MAEKWQIDGPKVIDIGSPDEEVTSLKVALVGGRVDVVTHDDSPTARIEVQEVRGRPLDVSWNGSTVRISHVGDKNNIWETFLQIGKGDSRLFARLSISIPASSLVTLSTVSADSLVNGVRSSVKGNTVSGSLMLDDIVGSVRANTVSGEIEAHALEGDLNANTVSGPITVLRSVLPSVKLNTVSGDITVDMHNGVATISSNSVSGDVTVRVPNGRGYDVTAHTASGDVVIDGKSMRNEYGPRGGQLTDGDRALVIKTNSVSGNVVVLRANASGEDRAASVQDTVPQDRVDSRDEQRTAEFPSVPPSQQPPPTAPMQTAPTTPMSPPPAPPAPPAPSAAPPAPSAAPPAEPPAPPAAPFARSQEEESR